MTGNCTASRVISCYRSFPVVVVAILWGCSATAGSLEADEPATRVRPFAPAGHLLLVGGGQITPEIRGEFVRLARLQNEVSRLVFIPTASVNAEDENVDWKSVWLDAGFNEVEILHTLDRKIADDPTFAERLSGASAVWIAGGDQQRLADAYAGTVFEETLRLYLERGGVVGGTSAGAAIASRVMIAGGEEQPLLSTGFDLLPGSIIDQHFKQRDRTGRLVAAVAANPQRVGLGIDESTAVVFHQRTMQVLGNGNVHLIFSATSYHDPKQVSLRPGQRWLDWTTVVRTNTERQQPPFPHENSADLHQSPPAENRMVPQGSLLIVGGGGATPDIWRTFVERAGGKEAKIVVLPTAVPSAETNGYQGRSSEANVFRGLGVGQVDVLQQTDEETVCSAAFCQKLSSATGIWFGGGRQWRFVDAYENTPAVAAMFQCLEKGGIIGGSSAGASIQGELLIRGAPVGNEIMVQDGYRRGFGFLPSVGIDQHFSQRNRFLDLETTIRRFPSILGVGIDESTALLVEKARGQVIGRGAVYFYDAKRLAMHPANVEAADRPIKVLSGQVIDLTSLEVE